MKQYLKSMCLFILMISCINNTFCQEMKISGGIGYGSYAMNSLKDFQISLGNRSGIPYKIVEDFPSYYNWFIGLEHLSNPHEFGIKVNSQTTGGRSTYMDYSGRADMDMIITEIAVGPTYKYQLIHKNIAHKLSLGGEAYLGFSDLEIIETINVYEQTNEQEINFNSFGISLMPNIHYRFQYKFAHCGIQFGYWIGIFNGPLKHNGNEIMDGRDKVKANWSGYRIRLEIGFGGFIKKDA